MKRGLRCGGRIWSYMGGRGTYTQVAKVQELASHCFEVTHTSVELAYSQCLEREFLDRVLDHFMSTYDWHQRCLPWTAHTLLAMSVRKG